MGSSVRPLHAGRRGLGLPRPDPRPQVSLNTYPRKPQAVLQGRLSFNLCRLQPCLFYPDLIRHHLAILSLFFHHSNPRTKRYRSPSSIRFIPDSNRMDSPSQYFLRGFRENLKEQSIRASNRHHRHPSPAVNHLCFIPKTSQDYVHRIGRTARAGKLGKVISLLSAEDHSNFKIVLEDRDLLIHKMKTPYFEYIQYLRTSQRHFHRKQPEHRRHNFNY